MRARRKIQQGPGAFGWTPADLRSAYAYDGTGPFLYAPDGCGPFSYESDGSGPFLVGPEGPHPSWAPPAARRPRRRLGTAMVGGALALAIAATSIGVVVDAHLVHPHPEHTSAQVAPQPDRD
jgi:hypothetical protein